MMARLPTVGGLAPDGASVLVADPGVWQPTLPSDFEHLLASGAVAPDGTDTDTGTDPFEARDVRVVLALAQVLDAEAPIGAMPSFQDGAMTAPWLMLALDARTADATVADDAASARASSSAVQAFGPARAAGQSAVQADLSARGAINPAPGSPAEAREAIDPVQAERLFTQRLGATPASADSHSGSGMNVAPAPTLNTRVAAEATVLAGPSTVTGDGAVRAGVAPADVPAPSSAAARTPTEPQQKLIDALGDRLSVQTTQDIRHAVIRLHPHLNGSVRIELHQDARGIAVHLSATHADVVRQLQAIGESLRQDLGARHGGDVTVQVSANRHAHTDADASGGRDRHARDDTPRQDPGRALAAADDDTAFELGLRDTAPMNKGTT
ncbi:flagellar hook-length control protein FliK [Burkholderia sp. BCC0044]|uniref:flagellar hook-length control protein FliK n=1 Tax=Burkholderia sp. BCC0044 TaxID=2676295 RepID=UPI00158CC7CB|nr:flagellar hook-length control protein FliK [Burkholderia sp. BCC0044]